MDGLRRFAPWPKQPSKHKHATSCQKLESVPWKKETEMEPHQTAESETNKRLAVYNL
jgi:hypothetical protein